MTKEAAGSHRLKIEKLTYHRKKKVKKGLTRKKKVTSSKRNFFFKRKEEMENKGSNFLLSPLPLARSLLLHILYERSTATILF
jgi:hypothetical protein